MKCPICKVDKARGECYHSYGEQRGYLRKQELKEINSSLDLCNVMLGMLSRLESGAHPGNNNSHCHWCGGERSIYSDHTNHRRYCFLEEIINKAKQMNFTPSKLCEKYYGEDDE